MRTNTKKYLILLYDDTLNGLLSAIFDVYRLNLNEFDIIPSFQQKEKLFKPILQVSTNKAKANRIKIGLKKKTGQNLLPQMQIIFDNTTQREKTIFQFIQKIFG